MNEPAVIGHHGAESRTGQRPGCGGDRVEARLQIGRRTGDDALRISAVAVCCSSASRCSVISRVFSMAITA